MTTAQNYQPQVGDTGRGANSHTYIPRADDASILVGGVRYTPQGAAPAVVVPVAVAPAAVAVPAEPTPAPSIPVAATPVVQQPYYVPAGGPATPVSPVAYPTYPFYNQYPYYNHYAVPGSYAPVQPVIQQGQPVHVQGPSAAYPIQPAPVYNHIQQPAFNSVGLTGSDLRQQQMGMHQGLNMGKKMDMKPADDNPDLWYWVREPDNSWLQRNRRTIDSGDIGKVRWFAENGTFYGVRLSG